LSTISAVATFASLQWRIKAANRAFGKTASSICCLAATAAQQIAAADRHPATLAVVG
jgi:hypothetical protein